MTRKVPCEEVMTPIITDEGLCYSFNIYDVRDIYSDTNTMQYLEEGRRQIDWTPDEGYRKHTNIEDMYPRRAFLSGLQNSFTATFYTDKRDLNYGCRDFSLQGIRVSLDTATKIPRPSQIFFSVGLDKLTTAAVTPRLTQTSTKIKHYSPEKRNCFFNTEKKLRFFRYYSQLNCNFECWTNYTKAQCGCVNFYMPKDNETRVCSLGKRFCLEDARLSYTQDILRERLKSAGSVKYGNKTTECNCLPLCSDLTYSAELSTSDWDFANSDDANIDEDREDFSNSRITKYQHGFS
ncbi:hypothetical protein HHI36_015351 [Cryptolaemus montrouzieri]|uniref:Uncharacterized protein n=1 Tax=Cryptolaemus montrouzieri TaxID=559131 RepID=A0ABD2N5F1_9CUCU